MTAWDKQLEEDREQTLKNLDEERPTLAPETYNQIRADIVAGEPGDDPRAPYHAEHAFATAIEEMLAKELGVDLDAYEAAIAAL